MCAGMFAGLRCVQLRTPEREKGMTTSRKLSSLFLALSAASLLSPSVGAAQAATMLLRRRVGVPDGRDAICVFQHVPR